MQIFAWTTSIVVTLLAFVSWGQDLDWQLLGLNIYQIFPLLGLVAFSLMWGHYVTIAMHLYFKTGLTELRSYFRITGTIVLGAILLHPGLIIWQLWRDGLGLPPGSTKNYVAPGMGLFVTIAVISLFIFLAYEFRSKFGKKPWWKFVQYANDLAMILIFIHGLRLGSQIQEGWFRTVWIFYGLALATAFAYIYYRKYKRFSLRKLKQT